MQIKLLLLDFDGTLADTRRANTLAYVDALAEEGFELSEELYLQKYFGLRCTEFLRDIGYPARRISSAYVTARLSSTPTTSTP